MLGELKRAIVLVNKWSKRWFTPCSQRGKKKKSILGISSPSDVVEQYNTGLNTVTRKAKRDQAIYNDKRIQSYARGHSLSRLDCYYRPQRTLAPPTATVSDGGGYWGGLSWGPIVVPVVVTTMLQEHGASV